LRTTRSSQARDAAPGYDGSRCDVFYRGTLSPDFYGWVFPHGETLSIGTGSADKGFSLRGPWAAAPASRPAGTPRPCAAKARRFR
jgi:flavin-dependent dehydrogenase